MSKIWLVEIRVKDWVFVPAHHSRAFTYEEVIANDEIDARRTGFEQFESRAKNEPALRRKMAIAGIDTKDCCAPDAVEIDH